MSTLVWFSSDERVRLRDLDSAGGAEEMETVSPIPMPISTITACESSTLLRAPWLESTDSTVKALASMWKLNVSATDATKRLSNEGGLFTPNLTRLKMTDDFYVRY